MSLAYQLLCDFKMHPFSPRSKWLCFFSAASMLTTWAKFAILQLAPSLMLSVDPPRSSLARCNLNVPLEVRVSISRAPLAHTSCPVLGNTLCPVLCYTNI